MQVLTWKYALKTIGFNEFYV